MAFQGGVSAQTGFIYQTMYAILLCLEKEDWTSIKMEPSFEEGNEKTDIFLDGSTSVSIQVKYRSSKMTSGEISNHYIKLCAEKNADAYILAVFADVTSPAKELIDQMNLSNREVDLRAIQGDKIFDYVRSMLFNYAYQKGVHYVSDQDLETVCAKLFLDINKNILSDVSYKKSDFEETVLKILQNSPSNCAFRIFEKSKENFFGEKSYIRDISPLRMINENLFENQLLEASALPKVRTKVNSEDKDFLSVVDYLRTYKGESRHIYLRGESGSGKSTSLLWIWNHYLQNQEKYGDVLPIYVPMIDIEDSIYMYLKAKWIDVYKADALLELKNILKEDLIEEVVSARIDKLIEKSIPKEDVSAWIEKLVKESVPKDVVLSWIDELLKEDVSNETVPFWLKNVLKGSGKQLLLMLDGFNELASQGSKGKKFLEKIKNEIVELSNILNLQLIVSSKRANDLKIKFTELEMNPLSREQILKYFINNSPMIIPEKDYSGVLSKPFLLEAYLTVYSENKNEYRDLTQLSLAKMMRDLMHKNLKEFINNSQDKTFADPSSITNADSLIILDVIYPLLAVGYEHIENNLQSSLVVTDSKRYVYDGFKKVLQQIIQELDKYEEFMTSRESSYGYPLFFDENGKIIKPNMPLQNSIRLVGEQAGILSDTQSTTFNFTWEHEIYRDYFIARGYALYAMANPEAEDFFSFLDQQMNYDYPNDLARKSLDVRRSNLLKSQMVIDLLDNYQEYILGDSQKKIYNKNAEKFKKTIVWKRILRNVSFTYEDIIDIRMVPSTELCMKYLGDDEEEVQTNSKYDYNTAAERWAELAYTYSGLGYNYTHSKVPLPFTASTKVEEEKALNRREQLAYIDKAKKYIDKANQIFSSDLIAPVKDDPFIHNNMARCLGNQAALLIRKADLFPEDKTELLNQAENKHREALNIRKTILDVLEKNVPINDGMVKWIKSQIAISHNGIGSVNYKNADYVEAIESHKAALKIREELNANRDKKISLENIVGCYLGKINKKSYTADDIRALLYYFVKLTKLVVEKELFFNIKQEIDRYNKIRVFLKDFEQSDISKIKKEGLEDYIQKCMTIIDENMKKINESNLLSKM